MMYAVDTEDRWAKAELRRFSKSGGMTPTLVGVLCAVLLTASYLRGHGNVHKLGHAVNKVVNPQEAKLVVANVGPGGQDPIRLTRSATSIGKDVEFLSATLLPGRGMNVFQITAMVPGHGEVALLESPAVETAAGQMNGQGDDAHGELSMRMGGALLMPWVGRQTGNAADATAGLVNVAWNGELLHFPALAAGAPALAAGAPGLAAGAPGLAAGSLTSVDGLFLDSKSTDVRSDVMPDGQYAQAVFHPAFGAPWPSTVDATVTVELSAHTLDVTISARNTGKVAAPVAIGWHPMFAIPSGDRGGALLKMPSSTVLAMNRETGLPTGRTAGTAGSSLDFSRGGGTRLGSQDVDAVYTQLKATGDQLQPVAELRDPAYNLAVQVIPMSTNIGYMHVIAPADRRWVSIEPNTSAPDAFGAEWRPQESGVTMLQPGASMQWKVRISVAAIISGDDRVQ